MLKLFRTAGSRLSAGWRRRWTDAGLELEPTASDADLSDPILAGCLRQLHDDGHADETDAGYLIEWPAFFEAIETSNYPDLRQQLGLPPWCSSRPVLSSSNSLTDHDFKISLRGWLGADGRTYEATSTGGVLSDGARSELLTADQWRLLSAVQSFARRTDDQRDDHFHRQTWGRIRRLSQAADALLDSFLNRSIVLTPEKLEIGLRKSVSVEDDNLIEIEPGFSGAPPDWLDRFDSARQVLDRYDIPTADGGIVQVLITPKVRTVLEEIKRLPSRRVAGSRAQAFILNPFATLGEDAKDVIIEGQFEAARQEAGLTYERFVPLVERDESGFPIRVGVRVESASPGGEISSETCWLTNDELDEFLRRLENALRQNFQLLAWRGFDLELQGESQAHLEALKVALEQRRKPPTVVTYAKVYDLSSYSARIEGIGFEKPIYSAYIAKKDDGDEWFPENVVQLVSYTPEGATEAVAVPATNEAIEQLRKATDCAAAAGADTVCVSWLPGPLPVTEAKDILDTFEKVTVDIQSDTFKPGSAATNRSAVLERLGKRKTLLLRGNIQAVEYEEQRRDALRAVPAEPRLPSTLRPSVKLLPHQCGGVAWLQHLHASGESYSVRGAVLADDMGLGKTLQLLTFMAEIIERDPSVDPMLVVAPVSLLENWREEADKFFVAGAIPILTAYGEYLDDLRVPREAIESRLRTEDGLIRFLKPKWIGNAKVVLTTYETLRDLEFSFAAQRWSFMVCDEAQRIKNPAAMVTRAAKKQNVGFKVACTGTPVENTLADLWCLFDYVQPGLLGALDEFGRRYRKPIEAKTDEERARVEELREFIDPQILRRTKAEVAKDLPPKVEDQSCRKLPLSATQRALYSKAIEDFKGRNEPGSSSPFKNHLGLLHYLRLLCTDPKRHGLTVFKSEPLKEYRRQAPKLDWLLGQLKEIQCAKEKVIVFCEFRNIQRLLQHYVREEFGLEPDIINGDTPASATHAASRQKRIREFQAAPGFGVIILSPVAIGFGVNIQAANHVIHYTRTWNPAKEDQATDRAYRIGQTKQVTVYYPVVYAPDFCTFDVKLDSLLSYKRGLATDMLNGACDVSPTDFAVADVAPPAFAGDIEERVSLDLALRMEWRTFEALAVALWKKRGFELCYCTPGSNDNGVDVVAISGETGQLIQTKTSSADGSKLGWDTVKEVVGGEAYYRRRHPKITFKKVGLTNQFFNKQAIEQAELNGVELLGQAELADLLERYPVTMSEVERILYSSWTDVET